MLDVVSRYGVHNPNVSITFQKCGDSVTLKTPGNNSVVENIRTIYGNAIAKELYHIEYKDDIWQFKMEGYLSNVNYSTRNTIFLLFINHRAVQSTGNFSKIMNNVQLCLIFFFIEALQKAIVQVYHTYLPKGSHPFLYLSLELEPSSVDVNVHPTKHEVNFLHEDDIIEKIKEIIEKKLLGSNDTRVFYTQV